MAPPEWTAGEFEEVLHHPELSSERLADSLPRRRVGAVESVRQGIHAYHLGMNTPMLTKAMVLRLAKGPLTCPVCQAGF